VEKRFSFRPTGPWDWPNTKKSGENGGKKGGGKSGKESIISPVTTLQGKGASLTFVRELGEVKRWARGGGAPPLVGGVLAHVGKKKTLNLVHETNYKTGNTRRVRKGEKKTLVAQANHRGGTTNSGKRKG